ncbi:replication initiator protein, partial [Saccharothrix algeriensis]
VHFAALLDRFVQNLRRCVGWDVQYFSTVEPQKRLAPHWHAAIRGSISRAELRAVAEATYHQV